MPSRTQSFSSPIGVLALGLGALACTGVMDGSKDGMGPGSPSGTGGSKDTSIDPEVARTQPVDPGHVAVHRLNTTEYNATVADILGTKLQPANPNWRGGELGGFDNMAAVLGVDTDQYRRYFDAAEALTKDVFANDALRAKIVTCALGLKQDQHVAFGERPLRDLHYTMMNKVFGMSDVANFGQDLTGAQLEVVSEIIA